MQHNKHYTLWLFGGDYTFPKHYCEVWAFHAIQNNEGIKYCKISSTYFLQAQRDDGFITTQNM
jgi:hypothetical protein